jgi:hypothetical protein
MSLNIHDFPIIVLISNGQYREVKFKSGDYVVHEGRRGIIVGMTIYPNTDYVFGYWMWPTHRGGDIPEDEIEFWDENART